MASLKVKEILCLLYSALLFLSGVLLIAFSVVLSYKLFYHFKFVPSNTIGPFIVIFLLGFVHLFLTWLGIKGPTREHDFHIILFMVITLVLLIVECAVGIWSVILWDESDVEAVQLITDSFGQFQKELIKGDSSQEKSWARLQNKLHCCGLNGAEEYKEVITPFPPLSCCDIFENSTCSRIFQTGCKQPLTRYVKGLMIDAATIGFCCCVFQALGVFAYFVFYRELKAERAARVARRLALQRSLSQDNDQGAPTAPHSAASQGMPTPPTPQTPPPAPTA